MPTSSSAPPPAANTGKKGAPNRANVAPVREEDLRDYENYLGRLKRFQTQTLKDPDSLGYFDEALRHYRALQEAHAKGLWTNALENVDKRLLQHSLQLMKDLLFLKNAMQEKKQDPTLYPLVCNLWRKNAQLVQEVLANSRNEWGFADRERKIEALSEAIQKTSALVTKPTDAQVGSALMDAANKMRAELEGPILFRRENRLWAGIVGGLGFLLGFTIYMLGILATPETMLGGILGIAFGLALMLYCGRMVYRAISPDDCDVDGIKNEKEHAREAALSSYEFGKAIKTAPTLFAPKTAEPQPKGKDKEKEKAKNGKPAGFKRSASFG